METIVTELLASETAAHKSVSAAMALQFEIGIEQCYQICQSFAGGRRTAREVAALDCALAHIAEQYEVLTVRQLYYRATVFGLVPKTEDGYNLVQRRATVLRRGGLVPYQRFADSTRWMRKPTTWSSMEQMLRHTTDGFRLDLWKGAERRCEIWCEKDALAGVISPITSEYDVPLMVSRGFSSITFLHQAATEIRRYAMRGVNTTVFLAYDFDASGQLAAKKVAESLRHLSRRDVQVELLAVTLEQIEDWDLPTRDPKPADFQKGWEHDFACELDAINPDQLQEIVLDAIESVADPDLMANIRAEEAAAKEALTDWADLLAG